MLLRAILNRSTLTAATGAGLVLASIGGGVWALEDFHAEQTAAAGTLTTRADALNNRAMQLDDLAATLDRAVTAAETKLADSDGKVLTPAERDQLAKDISYAKDRAVGAHIAADDAQETSITIRQTGAWLPVDLDRLASRITARTAAVDGLVDRLPANETKLTASEQAVDTAVAAWTAEQERIRREREAAEAAARAAAARAAAAAAAHPRAAARAPRTAVAAPAPTAGSRHFSVYVRTSVSSGGAMQAAVDAGGQVAIRYADFTIVAAHNFNDSTTLALRAGDTVTLSGAVSGTYTVGRSIRVRTGSSADPVYGLGTGLIMQTCEWHNGMTRLVGLY